MKMMTARVVMNKEKNRLLRRTRMPSKRTSSLPTAQMLTQRRIKQMEMERMPRLREKE